MRTAWQNTTMLGLTAMPRNQTSIHFNPITHAQPQCAATQHVVMCCHSCGLRSVHRIINSLLDTVSNDTNVHIGYPQMTSAAETYHARSNVQRHFQLSGMRHMDACGRPATLHIAGLDSRTQRQALQGQHAAADRTRVSYTCRPLSKAQLARTTMTFM